jgi:hypothetical protein
MKMQRFQVGNSEEKRPLGRPKSRWENNITMNLKEIGCGGMNRIHMAQNRVQRLAVVNTALNLRVP